MAQKLLFAAVLAAFAAACAPRHEEVVVADQPLTQEPAYTGKYK
jgi:hypothetical protein